MLDTITFGLVAVSSVVLVVAALLALYRLAVGPTGLDRGVASDVVLAVMIAAISYITWREARRKAAPR